MAVKLPLVIGSDGLPQQLQATDTISVSTSLTNTRSLTNSGAGALVIGTPVYLQATGACRAAQANAAATAKVIGLVYDASIAAASAGSVATDGVVVATTGQWDAVTGQVGGLTFNANYFLDPATPGRLTTTPPATVGQVNTFVGVAVSTTEMEVNIAAPILL